LALAYAEASNVMVTAIGVGPDYFGFQLLDSNQPDSFVYPRWVSAYEPSLLPRAWELLHSQETRLADQRLEPVSLRAAGEAMVGDDDRAELHHDFAKNKV
jgi:hypothetical protein